MGKAVLEAGGSRTRERAREQGVAGICVAALSGELAVE